MNMALSSIAFLGVLGALTSCDSSRQDGQQATAPTKYGPSIGVDTFVTDASGKVISVPDFAGRSWSMNAVNGVPTWVEVLASEDPLVESDSPWLTQPKVWSRATSTMVLLDDNGWVIAIEGLGDSHALVKDSSGNPVWKTVPVNQSDEFVGEQFLSQPVVHPGLPDQSSPYWIGTEEVDLENEYNAR